MTHAHEEIGALFERESRGLRALAGRLLNAGDADDLVQDGFLLLLRRGTGGLDRPGGWITGSIRNLAHRTRRGARRREARERASAPPEAVATVDDPGHAEILSAVVEAARALDSPYQEVVFRHYFQGETLASIARDLGCPEATVRTRLKRALERLRDRLGRRDPEWRASLALAVGLPCDVIESTSLLKSFTVFMGGLAVWKIGTFVTLIVGAWMWLGGADPVDVPAGRPENPAVAAVRPAPAGPEAPSGDSAERTAVVESAVPADEKEEEEAADLVLIEGLVVDRDGAAAPFAEVWDARLAGDRGGPFAIADEAGRFRVELERPPFQVCARADGHAGSFVETIPRDQATVELRFRLRGPASSLEGRVFDDGGAPVAGASVHVGHAVPGGAYFEAGRSRQLPAGPRVTTGPDGTFSIGGLAPERTGIGVTKDGFAPWERVVTPVESGTIRVTARLERGGTIVGTIRTEDGQPLEEALVSVSCDEALLARLHRIGTMAVSTRTDATGGFRLPSVPSGTARLNIDGGGWGDAVVVRPIIDGREERVDVTLARPAELRAKLVDERGAALAGWTVVAIEELGSNGLTATGYAKTAEDGTFSHSVEPSDDFELQICEPPEHDFGFTTGYTVLRLSAGEVSPDEPIVVDDGRRASAWMTGLIHFADLSDARDGRVLVEPLDGVRRFRPPHLGFSFAELLRDREIGPFPPGRYRVRLDLPAGSWTIREVTLTPGQRFDGGDELVPASTELRVRVFSEEGEPLPLIELKIAGGDSRTYRAPFPPSIRVMPGRYELTAVTVPGYCAESVEVEVESGAPADIAITMSREADLQVGFRSVTGSPLPAPPFRVRVVNLEPTSLEEGRPHEFVVDTLETELRLAAGDYRLRADDALGRTAYASASLEEHDRRAVIFRFR